ncbi:MAG: hypothetical protein STSR0002_07460 [Smithella sp.]|jgi:hypothetical protein
MTFYFHKEAETEFLEAIEYYESCTPGLGEDFSLEVNSTIQNICPIPPHGQLLKMMSTDV